MINAIKCFFRIHKWKSLKQFPDIPERICIRCGKCEVWSTPRSLFGGLWRYRMINAIICFFGIHKWKSLKQFPDISERICIHCGEYEVWCCDEWVSIGIRKDLI